MKKHLLLLFSCLAFLIFSHTAYSAERFYASGNIGLTLPNDSDISVVS